MKGMSLPKNRYSSVLFYLPYGVFLVCLLLVVFFPAKKIRRYCVTTVEQILPGTTCLIGSADYTFPLTLNFRDIRLSEKQRPEDIILAVQSLSVTANPRISGLGVIARLYDGELRCRLFVGRNNGTLILSDVEIRHIDLGKWKKLHEFLGRDISGLLNVSGHYSGNLKHILQGEAEGEATVRHGSMELLQPVLSLTAVNLKDSKIEFMFRNRILKITKGSFQGAEFDATFNGMFHVALPSDSSMLEITGDLIPTLSLINSDSRWKSITTILKKRYRQSTIPFVVSGTLAGPRFRIGS
jgi:type II secretion system protein N